MAVGFFHISCATCGERRSLADYDPSSLSDATDAEAWIEAHMAANPLCAQRYLPSVNPSVVFSFEEYGNA